MDDTRSLRIVMTGAGGGHFAPALAVCEVLPKETALLFVGRKHGLEGDSALSLEYQTAKARGIPFESITTGRLQRRWTRHTLSSLIKLPVGLFQGLKILLAFKPDVVVSFGGYISLPVVTAAYILRIPVVIHEQTLGVGLANKIASRFARRICVSWEESLPFFPEGKTVVTGNPIRKSLFLYRQKKKIHKSYLFITGGSVGSHAINVLIEGCLERLLRAIPIIHQTGDAKEYNDYEHLQSLKNTLPQSLQEKYTIEKFIPEDKIGEILAGASLVVARAGIGTITELIAFGKPALLIPLPFSQNNEQKTNAEFLKNLGLSQIYNQNSLTPDLLCDAVLSMLKNSKEYEKHAEEVKIHMQKDAALKILSVIQEVVN
ncbi:MAG: UDP-N-acetylglucosamine--N-acetylmuramyl-(pentapeptide) pyrophosphoryl-undecaprenol N-acetylglucosamine transferase [Candidatus Levybacteria bacterium]|nr:UDP-N-acetylglucosamine--N-acetylmuramyl-(pentapeptide) pyrophosphoryl-undecaprenol N-acetylglucosamine transferase [Candidatus Levybacteria bacterium]